MFDETQEARSVVRDRVQEGSLALLLDLEPAPLGDFDARDQHERLAAPCDIGDWDRRPGERTQCPVGTAELRLDLLGCSTGSCGGDCSRRPAVVVLGDQVRERQPDELVVAPAERLSERSIRTHARIVEVAVADRPFAIEEDGNARNRLERGRRRVALALELELALPALGDVETSGDDADHLSGCVLHGSGAPVDRADLVAQVREGVLVLAGREIRRECVEPCDHRLALGRPDEELPEVPPGCCLLVVISGSLERRGVDRQDASLRPDAHEQARRGVRHRAHEAHLRPELGLQAVVLERERGGCRHRFEELRLGVDALVVHDRGDPLTVPFDMLDRMLLVGGRLLDALSLWIDPGTSETVPWIEPVHDVELGVTDCSCERVAKWISRLECNHELRHRRTREPDAQDPQQESDRNGRRSTPGRREKTPPRFWSTRARSGDRR